MNDLNDLIKNNYDKIKKNTPLNPSLPKDDEWRNDTCWDELYNDCGIYARPKVDKEKYLEAD